jgi:hypothetical protein
MSSVPTMLITRLDCLLKHSLPSVCDSVLSKFNTYALYFSMIFVSVNMYLLCYDSDPLQSVVFEEEKGPKNSG